MIKRIVEVSSPSYLHCSKKQLKITRNEQNIGSIPIEDLGVLLLTNSRIVITQALINACHENNVVIIYCDNKHHPHSMSLPLTGHSLHTKILKQQIEVSKVQLKQLWQKIVKEKIKNQATTLRLFGIPHESIAALAERVQSNDKKNHEAQAAQKYWKLLFGKEFKRDVEIEGINAQLNYGYAIIRATLARAIVCSGLHPSLGIFHKNQYNAFCLADDLMEPFRPWIDFWVKKFSTKNCDFTISHTFKKYILSKLSSNMIINENRSTIFVGVQLFVNNIKEHMLSEDSKPPVFPYSEDILSHLEG